MGKLAKKKALIQEMEAIEALARVNVLCLDKTGTLTTGELEVEKIIPLIKQDIDEINRVLSAMAYSFDAVNATQLALQHHFSRVEGYDVKTLIPFSSQRKMSAVCFEKQGAYAMGAPEYLLPENHPVLKQVETYSKEGLRVYCLSKLT